MVPQKGIGVLTKKLSNITGNHTKKGSSSQADRKTVSSKKSKDSEEQDESYDLTTLARDVLVAIAIVLILFLALYLYTQKYPPLVVVESGSMQHGDESHLGVIDQGDLVLIKKVDSEGDITTWQEGKDTGYKTYGDYGDVIIYFKNGHTDDTPIIHRAIVYIKFNETKDSKRYYDVPRWDLYHVTSIRHTITQRGKVVLIHYDPEGPFSGFMTKGDNNQNPDQGLGGLRDNTGKSVSHVYIKWVDGVARGEIPWFGLIKLKISGNEHIDQAPQNSWTWLYVSITLIVSLPFVIEAILLIREKYLKDLEKSDKEEKKRNDGFKNPDVLVRYFESFKKKKKTTKREGENSTSKEKNE